MDLGLMTLVVSLGSAVGDENSRKSAIYKPVCGIALWLCNPAGTLK